MGETATDTRREIDSTRRQLGQTVTQLRTKTADARRRVVKGALTGAGATTAAALVAAAAVMVRRRRGGKLAQAARRLPSPAQSRAVPFARQTERLLQRRTKRAQQKREQLVELMSQRTAEHRARAERQANPLWRKAAARALETLATAGTAALVRRAFGQPSLAAHDIPQPVVAQPAVDLNGTKNAQRSGVAGGKS